MTALWLQTRPIAAHSVASLQIPSGKSVNAACYTTPAIKHHVIYVNLLVAVFWTGNAVIYGWIATGRICATVITSKTASYM